jgi:hypothetical protein
MKFNMGRSPFRFYLVVTVILKEQGSCQSDVARGGKRGKEKLSENSMLFDVA